MSKADAADRWVPFVVAAVPWVFALLGNPIPLALSTGLPALAALWKAVPKRRPSLKKYVRESAQWLDKNCRSIEWIGLTDAEHAAVIDLATRLLNPDGVTTELRSRLQGQALLGAGLFCKTVTGDSPEVAALQHGQRRYLDDLLGGVRALVWETAARKDEIGLTGGIAEVYHQLSNQMASGLTTLTELNAEVGNDVREGDAAIIDKLARQDEALIHVVNVVEELKDRVQPAAPSGQIVAGSRPRLVDGYVPRDEFAPLQAALADGGVATVCAVNGTRGVGKSQLAAAFAEDCQRQGWAFVGWVNAQTRQQAQTELAAILRDKELVPSYRLEQMPDTAERAKAMKLWLEQPNPSPRLLVLDNVTEWQDVQDLIPAASGVRVILTSTNRALPGRNVHVETFTEDQAVDYLIARTGLGDKDGARRVAQRLDRLPIAIAAAGNTMRLESWDYGDYLDALATELLDRIVPKEDGPDYKDSTGGALRLNYTSALKRLDKPKRAVGRRVLWAMSVLAESGVPRSWLYALSDPPTTARRVVGHLIQNSVLEVPSVEQPGAASQVLSDHQPDAPAEFLPDDRGTEPEVSKPAPPEKVSLHRLMAQVIREDAAADGVTERVRAAALEVIFAEDLNAGTDHAAHRQSVEQLSAQLAALLTQPQSRELTHDPVLLRRVAETCHRADTLIDPAAALALEGYLPLAETTGELPFAWVTTLRNGLAGANTSMGHFARSIAQYEQTLADCERILGPNHPNTLTSRNNLAYAYRAAGNLNQAIPLFEQTLTARERILGPNHPDTLTSRNNLAGAYQAAGNLNQAIPLYLEALRGAESVLGPDHPTTKTIRDNLADCERRANAGGADQPVEADGS